MCWASALTSHSWQGRGLAYWSSANAHQGEVPPQTPAQPAGPAVWIWCAIEILSTSWVLASLAAPTLAVIACIGWQRVSRGDVSRLASSVSAAQVEAGKSWRLSDQNLRHRLAAVMTHLVADDQAGQSGGTWFAENPVPPDVMGVNYYPQHSTEVFEEGIQHGGGFADPRPTQDDGVAALEESLIAYEERYGVPVMLTETAVTGSVEARLAWLDDSVACIRRPPGRRLHVVACLRHVRVDLSTRRGSTRGVSAHDGAVGPRREARWAATMQEPGC